VPLNSGWDATGIMITVTSYLASLLSDAVTL
jgi:hypothetical protein